MRISDWSSDVCSSDLLPARYNGNAVALMTDIEQLRVRADKPARVVVDEASGIIVMGENVRISTVAISQGHLTIRITATPQASQPNAFSNTGNTAQGPRTTTHTAEPGEQNRAVGPLRTSQQH